MLEKKYSTLAKFQHTHTHARTVNQSVSQSVSVLQLIISKHLKD